MDDGDLDLNDSHVGRRKQNGPRENLGSGWGR